MSKEKLESAVSKAGKAVADLVKAFELHGGEITDLQARQIFTHLQNTLSATMQRAEAARHIARAGAFSFDTAEESPALPLPAPPAPIFMPQVQAQPATGAAAPGAPQPGTWVKPSGRIAKSSPNSELAGKVIHQPIGRSPEKIKDELDPETKIGFIDASNG